MGNEELAQHAAEAFRNDHGLGHGPVLDVARLIERTTGIGVAQRTFHNSVDPGHGMLMTLGAHSFIAVACTAHPMRLRSTLAHELGHHVLATVIHGPHTDSWDRRSPAEIQADAFARHLLLPLAAVREHCGTQQATLDDLSALVRDYHVSPAIAAIQLRITGAFTAEDAARASRISTKKLATEFGWLHHYEALAEQSSRPRAPEKLLARALRWYRAGGLSPHAIAFLTGEQATEAAAWLEEATSGTELGATEAQRPKVARPRDTGNRLTDAEIMALNVNEGACTS